MNIYSIPYIVGGFFSLFLGLFVVIKNRTAATNKTFFLLCLLFSIWLLSYAIAYSTSSDIVAITCAGITCTAVVFVSTVLYHLVINFLDLKSERIILYAVYVVTFALGYFFITTNFFLAGVQKYFWGYYSKAGKLHPYYLIFQTSILIRAYYVLYSTFKNKKHEFSPLKQIQIKYFLIAAVLLLPAMVDYVPKYGVEIYPFGFTFILLFLSVIAYAIVRHQLMEIEVIIKKTLIYSILISIITILYFIIIYILERMFSIMIGYQSITLAIIIIAFFSIIFIPLKNKIQRTIDRYFFKGTIDQIEQEKKLLEGELQRSERLKTVSTLAAGMAHEIKNPLTSIKTFAEYLEKKYNDPAFRSKFKNIVPKEIDKISKIINQLLDYSKVDKVSLKVCNINSILDYVLDLYNNEFLKKHIKIQKSFNSQFPNITCDENQMKQAFINIVLNSIEAMSNGGELTIRTNDIDNILEVSIKDTGTGIPSDKLKCLFDPFYTTKQKGTGLGLFIVHQIIENNKGKIVIDTEIGKGTTIKVMFVR